MSDDKAPQEPQEPKEIDVNSLLGAPEEWESFVYDPQIESLPVERLSWQRFEKLCAKLLIRVSKSRLLQAFRYGRSGQPQFGIDILATKPGSKKQLLMQCKHVEKLNRGDLKAWVDKFLAKSKHEDADEFILCIACDFEQDQKLVEEWAHAAQRLSDKKIAPAIWGFTQINDFLRQEPEIVGEFFGTQFIPKFCSVAPNPEKYPERYRSQYRNKSENYVVFENETVRLDLFVPNERAARVSASLSFARADLSGITFAIPGETMVEWLQWAGHTSDLSKSPYASKSITNDDRYVFTAPEVRLMLDPVELGHLHWIFKSAWKDYLEAANSLESKWRFLRFDPIADTRNKTFGVMRVSRPLWRAILDFCQDHDFAKGSDPLNIFDGAPGVLKIYVDTSTADLDRGYHLIMYAYQSGGIAGPYDDSLTLGWSALTSITDVPEVLHPRKAWDAELAHNWLLGTLIPAIEDWINRKNNGKQQRRFSLFGRMFEKPESRVDLTYHFSSLARLTSRDISGGETSLQRLIDKVHNLQSHFHVYTRKAEIESQLAILVLESCARLANLIPVEKDSYIRGNLRLGDGKLTAELMALAQSDSNKFRNPNWLDYSLRSLIALLEGTDELPESELILLSEVLSPIWSRMREDWICSALY
jgi:hypothetical protein